MEEKKELMIKELDKMYKIQFEKPTYYLFSTRQ